jgi:hypothetical protein
MVVQQEMAEMEGRGKMEDMVVMAVMVVKVKMQMEYCLA